MGVALYRWVKVQLEETGNDIHKKKIKKNRSLSMEVRAYVCYVFHFLKNTYPF